MLSSRDLVPVLLPSPGKQPGSLIVAPLQEQHGIFDAQATQAFDVSFVNNFFACDSETRIFRHRSRDCGPHRLDSRRLRPARDDSQDSAATMFLRSPDKIGAGTLPMVFSQVSDLLREPVPVLSAFLRHHHRRMAIEVLCSPNEITSNLAAVSSVCLCPRTSTTRRPVP